MLTGVDGSVEFFDTLEQTDWNQSLQRTLIHWLGLRDADDVLDAGCGAGRFATHLAQRTSYVTALDASQRMVERAKRSADDYHLTNISCVVGNIRALPFPDDVYDMVTCLDVLFMFEDPRDGLRELVRVAKPGARIVLLNPSAAMNPWSAQTFCEEHEYKDFQRDSFLAWSTAAAKRRLYDTEEWQTIAADCDADIKDVRMLMDGLVAVYVITPRKAIPEPSPVPPPVAEVDTLPTDASDAEQAEPAGATGMEAHEEAGEHLDA